MTTPNPTPDELVERLIKAYIATRTPARPGTPDWAMVRQSLECELFARAVSVIIAEALRSNEAARSSTTEVERLREDALNGVNMGVATGLEMAIEVAEQIERQQDTDHGAANSGGAQAVADALRARFALQSKDHPHGSRLSP